MAILEIVSGALGLASGIAGYMGADEESSASQEYAKTVKSNAWDTHETNKDIYQSEYETTKEALELDLKNDQEVYGLRMESAQTEREANSYTADAIIEQSKQDMLQNSLEAEESTRQIEENLRAARMERAYAQDAAVDARRRSAQEEKDFRRETSSVRAMNKAEAAASGFDMSGSPMLVDEALMVEIEIGASRILHKGDVEFFGHLKEIQQINSYIRNEKVSRAGVKKSAEINEANIKARRDLELEGNAIALKEVETKEKAALQEKHQSEKENELLKYTAQETKRNKKKSSANQARSTSSTAQASANVSSAQSNSNANQSLIAGVQSITESATKVYSSLSTTGSSFK